MIADTLLTPAEVARRLRKRKETILAMIHSGELAALNTPGPSGRARFKIRPADLDAYERSQLVTTDAPQRQLPPGVTDYYATTSKRS